MPTYHYRCHECGHEFEVFQSMTEDPIKVCPGCKGETQRVISGGAGFLLKGSGFYQTDYRSKSYIDSAKKEKSEATAASAKSSSTSDSSTKTKSSTKKPSE